MRKDSKLFFFNWRNRDKAFHSCYYGFLCAVFEMRKSRSTSMLYKFFDDIRINNNDKNVKKNPSPGDIDDVTNW